MGGAFPQLNRHLNRAFFRGKVARFIAVRVREQHAHLSRLLSPGTGQGLPLPLVEVGKLVPDPLAEVQVVRPRRPCTATPSRCPG